MPKGTRLGLLVSLGLFAALLVSCDVSNFEVKQEILSPTKTHKLVLATRSFFTSDEYFNVYLMRSDIHDIDRNHPILSLVGEGPLKEEWIDTQTVRLTLKASTKIEYQVVKENVFDIQYVTVP